MSLLTLTEQYGHNGRNRDYRGEVELIVRDRAGRVIQHTIEKNIVKIFAKELLSHSLAPREVWDPTANSGAGDWVDCEIPNLDDFVPRYFLFGAAFDSNNVPLTSDPRFYAYNSLSGTTVPVPLGVGAEFSGGLINAIPISEPTRPLKRVERIYFEPSYQPAGTPQLQDDVRAMNNVLVFETVLRKDEYNGFGVTSSDYFTITEIALVGGKQLGLSGACECDPKTLFLEGHGDTESLLARATGSPTITLDSSEYDYRNLIKEGDQIKIVEAGATDATEEVLDQVSPYYLVITKAEGGSDITLDRTPATADGTPITGTIGVFRDTLRIFSHRILEAPPQKSLAYEITCRWRIIMS
jgi:hypothetical protein